MSAMLMASGNSIMDRDVHLILIDHWRDTEWLGSRRILFW